MPEAHTVPALSTASAVCPGSHSARILHCISLNGVNGTGKRVGDYGIGAGLLGQLLCTEYSVAHYFGIDIASRQLEATAARLDRIPKCNHTLVLQTSKMDFGAFRLDVFISQQVIQHFPSSKYLDDWLAAIQSARIPLVFLEIRYAQPARFSEWVHDKSVTSRIARDSQRDGVKYSKTARQVQFATLVSCEYLLQRIPAYRLDDQWETIKGSSDSVFHACSFILT